MERTGHSLRSLTNVNVIKDTQDINAKVGIHADDSDEDA